ncbi:MAG: histidine kinase [Siculibacillus sp.]
MPTLMRLLVALAIGAVVVIGAAVALATLVEPRQREMVIKVPQGRFDAK